MFYVVDLEDRVRADHPLRPLKAVVDAELARMGHLFNRAYSDKGRPSVPPERLLKAMLLQALYAVRSEAQLVERIDTDLLFRWFLDMDPAMDVFDPTAFTHNRPRLEEFGIVQRFFGGVVRRAMDEGLTSDGHFSADGTLIQSYASLKSLRPIDPKTGEVIEQRQDDDDHPTGRNAPVDFKAPYPQPRRTDSLSLVAEFPGKSRVDARLRARGGAKSIPEPQRLAPRIRRRARFIGGEAPCSPIERPPEIVSKSHSLTGGRPARCYTAIGKSRPARCQKDYDGVRCPWVKERTPVRACTPPVGTRRRYRF
jgi:transposase